MSIGIVNARVKVHAPTGGMPFAMLFCILFTMFRRTPHVAKT